MTPIDWFWAIVANAVVIGGAVLGAMIVWYWLVVVAHRAR